MDDKERCYFIGCAVVLALWAAIELVRPETAWVLPASALVLIVAVLLFKRVKP